MASTTPKTANGGASDGQARGRSSASAPASHAPARWVCLMYHDVLPATTAGGGGPERFAVPVTAFRRMLDAIRAADYAGRSVADTLAADRRSVAITFDDGAISQYEHALPALIEHSMTATFYVTTDWIGRPGYMSWAQLRELEAQGMSVQSHSRSHPFLSELNESALRSELAGSKAALDDGLGRGTTEISLPGGDAPRRSLRHLVRDAGYEIVAGSRWGVNRGAPPARGFAPVRRCTVRGDVDAATASRMLEGDLGMALARYPREAALARIRATLGPTRYARWRRGLLDVIRRG